VWRGLSEYRATELRQVPYVFGDSPGSHPRHPIDRSGMWTFVRNLKEEKFETRVVVVVVVTTITTATIIAILSTEITTSILVKEIKLELYRTNSEK
jgi:hypothetical protein